MDLGHIHDDVCHLSQHWDVGCFRDSCKFVSSIKKKVYLLQARAQTSGLSGTVLHLVVNTFYKQGIIISVWQQATL